MAIPKNFPQNPYAILAPDARWYPGKELLIENIISNLLPPLVSELRQKVKEWRDNDYAGASPTTHALLRWWFEAEERQVADGESFEYYFAQREAIESIIYLYEIAAVRDKYDLARYDKSGHFQPQLVPEEWRRFVIKMATGSGKTKVISLVIAWSYFHKLYESDSPLSRNTLLIAPNIIVLDRLRADFDGGLRIFYRDRVVPDNGYEGQSWRNDFQLQVHIQDEVRNISPIGNLFLTNIHRVFTGNKREPSPDDDDTSNYFLGPRPTGKMTDSKIDLGEIVRDIDELLIINDEAHHIHDDKLAWFKAIQDIHNHLLQKESNLALQVDLTATPKHDKGEIFKQTIADYPLVEAIYQNVVKRPVLPDAESQQKLRERPSSNYCEMYKDYLELGVKEWRKAQDEHKKLGKKAILFIMTDDTKNCDAVADYLESTYADLKDKVLVIHTKRGGDIKDGELDKLRKAAREIDNLDNKYHAVVSVLMLREGWDVKNVTTIVGLRAYAAKSNILPEQTLGRGLRRMYGVDLCKEEYVSVTGTSTFVNFVRELEKEGVKLEQAKMGERTPAIAPLIIEIDRKKDKARLDIEIPVLEKRFYRDFENLRKLDPVAFPRVNLPIREIKDKRREIVFRDAVSGEITHKTMLSGDAATDQSRIIAFFVRTIMREMRLFSSFDILYEKTRDYIRDGLFDEPVDLDDENILRNLAETAVVLKVVETLRREINRIINTEINNPPQVVDRIIISDTRPFGVKQQNYLVSEKTLFNRIVGDSQLELDFAASLGRWKDVTAFAKNYFAVGFRLDYEKEDGRLASYHPDFIVRNSAGEIYIVETKGREDLDDIRKFARLEFWCKDANAAQEKQRFFPLLVAEEKFRKYPPKSFAELVGMFQPPKTGK